MFEQHPMRRALSASLLVAAASFPAAAQASPAIDPPAAAIAPSVDPTASGGRSGFDWGDAGIGAAGAILLVGTGGALAGGARRRRTHRAVTS
jgi:hypothetical protein